MLQPWRIRGTVLLNPGIDRAALMPRLAAGLRGMGCQAVVNGNHLRLESGSPDRYSVLAFVDGGDIWLQGTDQALLLRYNMPTLGGLRLCGILSLAAGAVSWFSLGEPWLTVFAFVTPVAWLYGANFVISSVRIPGRLRRLCDAA